MKAKTMSVYAKCSDMFAANFYDKDKKCIMEYDGYVPDWMPGNHWGDYIELEIDLDTGQILNWTAPSEADITNMMEENSP